ncbi:MAG: lipoprotein-releasing system ATP-binding protein LolD [Chitinophagales bacterium]|nr:MAG: lipoprotein-releasing system ATP-binding protein LolD [Chitinophagales bacterium]
MTILEANNLHKSYGRLQVLKGIDLTVQAKEIVSIVGASGAGKSTLLHVIGTIDRYDSGRVVIDGTDLRTLHSRQLARFRNQKIGFVFQFHHLLPEFTALENVQIPALIGGADRKQSRKEAIALLERLGLADRLNHKPAELSGGEQQRVAVARALINKPAVVMADEPSGNLDSENARALHHLFLQLRNEQGQTFIIVTHNAELAMLADRRLVMKDGRIIADESTHVVPLQVG